MSPMDWQKIGFTLRTIDLVRTRYDRLVSTFDEAINRGAEKRSRPFYEWAAGKVLLDIHDVKLARESVLYGTGDGGLIRDVCDSFLETDDRRLVPALTFDKDGQTIIVVIIQP